MRDLHIIRTPENVTFEFELAGLSTRALAWVIDVGVMTALLVAATSFAGLFGMVVSGAASVLYFVLAFGIQWGYGALLEWRWHGQTLGKRIVGLRVLALDGTPVTFVQAAIRNLVRVVDLLPATYLLGALSVWFDPHARRLGDIAASTVVVRKRSSPRPTAVVTKTERYNSFLEDPAIARAVSRITPPERDAMVGLAMRRENLPLPVRHALFSRLAKHLEKRLSVPRPSYFSEERFVLNLAAVALGGGTGPSRASEQAEPARVRTS